MIVFFMSYFFLLLDSGTSCVRQPFLSETTVRTQALLISNVVKRDRTQRIFPDMYFSCSGVLTKWIIGGEPGSPHKPLPELQLWRMSDGAKYLKTNASLIHALPKVTLHKNVYEYILDPPLEFQKGDVFGLYKPEEEESVLNIFLQENNGPFAYGKETGAKLPFTEVMAEPTMLLDQNDYPMVSVEISITSEWQCL